MSQAISVRVNDQLTLDLGVLHVDPGLGEAGAVLQPPASPLVDQVIAWLEERPSVPDAGLEEKQLARATVAVCLRWGSWFALAADPSLPLHAAQPGEAPMTAAERDRLRAELTAGLERWCELRRDDPARHRQLAARALAYLPGVPEAPGALPSVFRRHLPADTRDLDELRAGLHGLVFVTYDRGAKALMELLDHQDHSAAEAARAAAYTDPMGVLGRALTWSCWEVESLAATLNAQPCTAPPLSRRYGTRAANAELRRVIKNLAAVHKYVDGLFDEEGRSWGEKVVAMVALQ